MKEISLIKKVFILYSIFLLVTVSMFIFSPFEFKYVNYSLFLEYMVLVYLFIALGYICTCVRNKSRDIEEYHFLNRKYLNGILIISLIFLALITLINLVNYVQEHGFHIVSLSSVYFESYKHKVRFSNHSYSLNSLAIMFGPFFFALAFLILLFYYRKITYIIRILIIAIVLIWSFSNIIVTGSQKSISLVVIYLLFFILIKLKLSIKRVLLIIVLCMVFFLALINVQESRYQKIGINYQNYNQHALYINSDGEKQNLVKVPKGRFNSNFDFFTDYFLFGYLYGGFYGLALSLNLEHSNCYLLCSSYSFSILVSKLGINSGKVVHDNDYRYKVERKYGYPAESKWYTPFPDLASDFTYSGALLIILVFSYMFFNSIKNIEANNDFASILLASNLFIFFLFLPMNNQMLLSVPNFFLFVFSLLLFLFRKKRSC